MTRMQGTQRQLRKLRDDELRIAGEHIRDAVKARKGAQDTARRLQEKQWDAAYLGISDPERAERVTTYLPYLERSMLRDLGIARDREEKAEFHLTQARKAAAQLTRRRYQEKEPSGLGMLIRMCLQGWRNKRARRERSLESIYHLH